MGLSFEVEGRAPSKSVAIGVGGHEEQPPRHAQPQTRVPMLVWPDNVIGSQETVNIA